MSNRPCKSVVVAACLCAAGVTGLGITAAHSDTYYFRWTCYRGYLGCTMDGVCQQVEGMCTVTQGSGQIPYTQKKNTAFVAGGCTNLFTGYDCQDNTNKTVCITQYYWDSPDCELTSILCNPTTTIGTDCMNMPLQ